MTWLSRSKFPTSSGQIQDRNNYPARAVWNTAPEHVGSDALSIFHDITNCPPKLFMIHFFDELDLKKKNPTWFSGLELLLSLSTVSAPVCSERQSHWEVHGMKGLLQTSELTQWHSTNLPHQLIANLWTYLISIFPQNTKSPRKIHSREQNTTVQNGICTPSPG